MRMVAFSLLLINMGLFAYYYLDEGPEPRVVVTSGKKESVSVKLLAEVTPDEKQRSLSSAVENPISGDQLVSAQGQECFGIGPFADVFGGQNALDQLAAVDVIATLRAVDEATGESDYRVLIPPASSAEEAFRKLRELQASNIDSYVITQGEQSMGISLGVFSSVDGAQTLLDQLASMGYEADILEIERQSRSYWIELESGQFGQTSVSNWLSLNGSLGSREMKCTES